VTRAVEGRWGGGWPLVLPILAMLWGVYLGALHPWLMNWGATAEEIRAPLPGDEIAAAPCN
jgi:hypothetical protein